MRYRREITIFVRPLWPFLLEKRVLTALEHHGIISAAWRGWRIHWPYQLTCENGPIICEGE